VKPNLYQDALCPIPDRVKNLLGRMTLEEKLAQLGSAWVFELQEGQAFSETRASKN
jgi:beta-glucosidase